MMYRRNAAQTPRPADNVAKASFVTMAASQVLNFLASMGIIDRAHRENRRRDRHIKRTRNHGLYSKAGLNGSRAVARRERQRLTGHSDQSRGFV